MHADASLTTAIQKVMRRLLPFLKRLTVYTYSLFLYLPS